MPSDQEVADAVVHHSDLRKNRLTKRFGNPALRKNVSARTQLDLSADPSQLFHRR